MLYATCVRSDTARGITITHCATSSANALRLLLLPLPLLLLLLHYCCIYAVKNAHPIAYF